MFLIFGIIRGEEGQKMAQNDKKLCLSHSVSQEWYIIWYITHQYLQVLFFIFFKKCNIVNIKIILFFIGLLQHLF